MRLKFILIFVTLLIAAQAITMEYLPSFTFFGGTTRKVTPLKAGALQWFSQNLWPQIRDFQIYKEVERIIKSGFTVDQVETKKLRDTHKRILEEYRKCAQISDQNWDEFEAKFEKTRSLNPLFKKLAPDEYDLLLREMHKNERKSDNQTEKLKFEAKAKHDIFLKLQERGLNPGGVKIDFENEQFAAARQETKVSKSNQLKVSNILEVGKAHSYKDDAVLLNGSYDHEITHLQENHTLEAAYLDHFSTIHEKENKCLKPYHHQTEFEADLLYSFKNLNAAHHSFIANCYYYNEEDSFYHPSSKRRCRASYRAYKMLEIEKALKEKQKSI